MAKTKTGAASAQPKPPPTTTSTKQSLTKPTSSTTSTIPKMRNPETHQRHQILQKGVATTRVEGGVKKKKNATSANTKPSSKSQKDEPEIADMGDMDIDSFIESQEVNLETLKSMALRPVSKKEARKKVAAAATAAGGKGKKGGKAQVEEQDEDDDDDQDGMEFDQEDHDDDGEEGLDEDDEDVEDGDVVLGDMIEDEDLLDMEEEAELKAYLEIKEEEKKARKAALKLRREAGEDVDDEEEDDDDDDEDEDGEEEAGSKKVAAKVYINDKAGLLAAYEKIRLDGANKTLPWIEFQSVTSKQPLDLDPKDVDDDLKRETAIYKQALEAVHIAHRLLKDAKVPIWRPDDYYAEMIKSDEHMMRVRQKLVDEANAITAAEKARKQRDAKKFGKKVQQEKLAERERSKKSEIEKVKLLRKKANSTKNSGDGDDDGDDFGIGIDSSSSAPSKRGSSGPGGPNAKRKAKDSKYGFGGKKKYSKENTRESTDDLKGFNPRKMKAGISGAGGKGGKGGKRGTGVGAYKGLSVKGGGGVNRDSRPVK
ncbi:rRNA-processing protein and EBNA1-binding protein ebp2 [Blyttiomyces sp. JEL0837]|nr:rRNA-processing protein and EBNA1-binding protein ebp2 [Blyttiomyces sp. JEL0837]